MKVYLATDHAGFTVKEAVKEFLRQNGYSVEDCGAYEQALDDDYPDFVSIAAKKVAADSGSFGIVFGGSGQGEAMAANKVKGIRCGVFYGGVIPHAAADIVGRMSTDTLEIIRLLREHNDANMLSISGRFVKETDATQAVKLFLETAFSNEERHKRRIDKVKEIEEK